MSVSIRVIALNSSFAKREISSHRRALSFLNVVHDNL